MFLSSVVLAGLTWAFTEYQGYASQEKAKEALKERLSTEIAFRISNAIAQNKLDTKRLNSGEQFSTYSLFSTDFDYLNNEVYDRNATPPYQIDYSVFPEYKNRTFRSLLRELRNTVGKEDIKHLHDAEDEYIKLEDIVDAADLKMETSKVQSNATATDAETVHTSLLQLQSNSIWKNFD
jgi:hypothetical protein